jgi:cysteinyl-tRNA synthetase
MSFASTTPCRDRRSCSAASPNDVRMYVCGPTVYADAHIGHAMAAIVFDTVRRYLTYKGYTRANSSRNFTDVDDKIINARQRATTKTRAPSPSASSTAYRDDLSSLNVLPPDVEPRSASTSPRSSQMVGSRLIARGHAYPSSTATCTSGRSPSRRLRQALGRKRLDDCEAGERVDVDERKRKETRRLRAVEGAKPGEPAWVAAPGAPAARAGTSSARPWPASTSATRVRHPRRRHRPDLPAPRERDRPERALAGLGFANYWLHNAMGDAARREDEQVAHANTAPTRCAWSSSPATTASRSPFQRGGGARAAGDAAWTRLRGALRPAHGSAQHRGGCVETLRHRDRRRRASPFTDCDGRRLQHCGRDRGALFELVRKAINSGAHGGRRRPLLRMPRSRPCASWPASSVLQRRPRRSRRRSQLEVAATPFIELLVSVRARPARKPNSGRWPTRSATS